MIKLECLSCTELRELIKNAEMELHIKETAQREVALVKLQEAWKEFRQVSPIETHFVSYDDSDLDCEIDIDLYDLIDAYGFQ